MSSSGFRCSSNSFDFESVHQNAEDRLLRSFSNFGKSFQGHQDVYTKGVGQVPPGRLSLLLSPDAELISSVHNLKSKLVALYTLGFNRPFERISQTVDLFFWIIRHCANRSDWGKIGTLESVVRDCREEITKCRAKQIDPYHYDLTVMHFFTQIDDCILGADGLRNIVYNREQDIGYGLAEELPYSCFLNNARAQKLEQMQFDFGAAFNEFKSDVKSELENLNSKIESQNSKLNELNDNVIALANRKPVRKSLKLTEKALKVSADCWNQGQHAKGWTEIKPGRAIDKNGVYHHFESILDPLGIHNTDDYRRALDNVRKQHPEWLERHLTRKKSCQGTLFS